MSVNTIRRLTRSLGITSLLLSIAVGVLFEGSSRSEDVIQFAQRAVTAPGPGDIRVQPAIQQIPEVGITLLPPAAGTSPAIDGTQARLMGGMPEAASVTATLADLTDDNYVNTSTGIRILDHRLVWLVTSTGVCLQAVGGHVPGEAISSSTCPNHENNVIIDAMTGEFLESFTYR